MSNFAVRASLPKGSMINEGGKLKATGSHSLELQTPYGKWTVAFADRSSKNGPSVEEAVNALNGVMVTMIYQPK
jgi:hypothetical protein